MAELRVDAPAPQHGPEREDEDTSPPDRSGREAQRPDAFKQAAGMKSSSNEANAAAVPNTMERLRRMEARG